MSTLFVKQHVIMDAIAGILLVEVVTAVLVLLELKLGVTRRERQKSTLGA
jgi:hypothetical protein